MKPRSISLAESLFDRHMGLMRERMREADKAADKGDKKRQSIASTEAERHRFAALEIRLIIDCFFIDDEPVSLVIVPRNLLVEAHACMRETGWHLAPSCDDTGDGVLACAVADVEDRFSELLNHRPASPVAAKEGT